MGFKFPGGWVIVILLPFLINKWLMIMFTNVRWANLDIAASKLVMRQKLTFKMASVRSPFKLE